MDKPAAVSVEHAMHDPYLTWARHTHFRYLTRGAGPVRLAGELREGSRLEGATQAVLAADKSVLTARAVLGTRFFTATLSQVTEPACNALLRHAQFVLAEPAMRAQEPWALNPPASGARPVTGMALQSAARLPHKIVVGVIDGRCGFATNALCAGGMSRLHLLWDQEGTAPAEQPEAEPSWIAPADFGYGRELDGSTLNAIAARLAAAASAPQRVELEKALYRELGHRSPDDADWSHGTHVLDTVLRELADAAASVGVSYVQLPDVALRDTSARWTAAYVLDAIDYIVSRAAPDARVVINLSLGAFAGPHDGSSLLERALRDIASASRHRVTFVVAAGNAGLVTDDSTGAVKRCHARFTLAPGEPRELWWDIDRPDATESFLELWAARTDSGGLGVRLEHERDNQMKCGEVAPDTTGGIESGGQLVGLVVNATGAASAPNGQRGMVLIALGHTRGRGPANAPAGRWRIVIANKGKTPIDVDAWIERRDIPGELVGERPQYGFAPDNALTEDATLGSLANGREPIDVDSSEPIVVGALETIDATLHIADYSSRGPSLPGGAQSAAPPPRSGPDVYAPGRATAAGFFSGATKELSGTSVAAARVTAAVASALADPRMVEKGDPARAALSRWIKLRWEGSANMALAAGLQKSTVVLPR